MIPIAPGVFQFRFLWRNLMNAYYVEADGEGVVVDASTRWDRRRMVKQLRSRKPTSLVLTHAHPDHQGGAKRICEEYGLPMMCHELDVESAEGRAPLVRQSRFFEFMGNLVWAGPRHKVSRTLREGDKVAGFTVYHLPGHTPGHIVLLRESDRVAIVGDVLNNNHIITHRQCLREPPHVYSFDVLQNRESIRRLHALKPSLMCFGHGPILRTMRTFDDYVERLKRLPPPRRRAGIMSQT